MATKQEIQNVIDATDIVSLVSEYLPLEKQGKNYKGLCPFHHEDTPSFVVSPDKKLAHCFGCGGGGDPIKFVMQIENIEYHKAISKLALRAGIKLSDNDSYKQTNPLAKYHKIMETAVTFYKKYLDNTTEGLEAKEYLKQRGIDDEIIKAFNIGLSASNYNSLYNVLKESNYLELDMLDVGLVDKNEKDYYDLFNKRIMFPIYDENNNPIGFSGRIFRGEDNQPKYVNTRETVLFKKRDVLFNLNQAKGEILKRKRVILHEGQMDVIASYKSGLKEAICTMGTALSLEQAKILKKYTNHAIICYDGDKAGINASLKAINIFNSLGFKVHLCLLPNKMDPDEYVLKHGSEEYVKFFENNLIDSYQYIFEQAFIDKNLTDETVVDAIKNQIFGMLASSKSSTIIEQYLKKLALRLNVSLDSLNTDFQKHYTINKRVNNVEDYYEPNNLENSLGQYEEAKPVAEKWNPSCELRLFMYARASKEKAKYIDKVLEDRMDALDSKNQNLWSALVNHYYERFDKFSENDFIRILSVDDYAQYQYVLEKLRYDKIPYSDENLNECLEKLKEINLKNRNQKLQQKLSQKEDALEKLKIIQEKFRNKKQQINLSNTRRK